MVTYTEIKNPWSFTVYKASINEEFKSLFFSTIQPYFIAQT